MGLVRQLIELRAPMGQQWQQLAQIMAENGEVRLAKNAMALLVESAGNQPAARYAQAGFLSQMGDWAGAHSLLASLPPDEPSPLAHAYSRGTSALYLGKAEEAREQLERAASQSPETGQIWLSLATLTDFAGDADLAERIIAREKAMAAAPPAERGAYYYALGKVHADRGEYAPAGHAFMRGARDLRSGLRYDRDRDRQMAEDAVDGYDADWIADMARRQSEATDRSIFVIGLPRSGTTLVEQILTSHSAVCDGGEINRLSLLVNEAHGLRASALDSYVTRKGIDEPARLWRHWIDERFPQAGRIVDKTPHNSRLAGIAAALLPEAPLIWMTRDPLDCAWSCFRTCFMQTQSWSYDLEDIAFHFRLEEQLLAHWRGVLGDRLLVVPYEELVTEPEQWTRTILTHCGLAEEPQVFAPHESKRAVTTSSVMQVRRPINRKAIGAAEPYREFMQPFIDAYGK